MLAIIGGTGLYNLEDIDIRDSRKIKTLSELLVQIL